jgi:hypothetical protein
VESEELEQNRGVAWKRRNPLAVMRVAPDDVLWVRERPGENERVSGQLAHDARGIRATGPVCQIGKSIWFEILAGSTKGWANGAFFMPATEPANETERFKAMLGSAKYKDADELVTAVVRGLEEEQKEASHVRFEVRLLGVSRKNGTLALLYACCFADDSAMGEQIWLDLTEATGSASLRGARVSVLCPRGTTKNLCN